MEYLILLGALIAYLLIEAIIPGRSWKAQIGAVAGIFAVASLLLYLR